MRIIILTQGRHGMASRVLPALLKNKNIDVVKVVLVQGQSPNKKRNLKRKINKVFKIGFLGALNGIRMRSWFSDGSVDSIDSLCESYNIELAEAPYMNSDKTKELFKEAKADLGLSLGNGYIPESVFSIPKYGMVNIHTEILPKFQGAQSIIWPIYEEKSETGFTIHQIDSKIDTGNILYQEKYPIKFYATLQETVENNLKVSRTKIPNAFSYVCQNYISLKEKSINQKNGNTYTTPSIWQFIRMTRNNKKFYKKS